MTRSARPLALLPVLTVALGLPPAPPAAPATTCRPTLAAKLVAARPASQLVTVTAAGPGTTSASVRLWARTRGCWTAVAGPWRAQIGRNGVSGAHREGDGTTPTGVYGIGPVVYGTAPDPGVHYRYHRLVCGDWWDEDPGSASYNSFQHVRCDTEPRFGGGSEALWRVPAYAHFVVIDYNAHPAVAGRGSAIFIHDGAGGATHGCVRLRHDALEQLLRWLRPARAPLVAIGTSS